MTYPKINEDNKRQTLRQDTFLALGKIYDTSSNIEEYKVNRDVMRLKCPTFIDAFIVFYLMMNYGKGAIFALSTIASTSLIMVVALVLMFICSFSLFATCILSIIPAFISSILLCIYLDNLYRIGYRYTA